MAHEKKVVETPVEYDPQYILQVKDLKKHFPIKGGMISKTVGYVKAVDGVTFNLKRGTTMGLVGESGCGKTTTGRTILRLAGEKTGGQVLFNGKDVYALSDKEMRDMRTKMQIIFQDPFSSLQPRMPVGEIIGEAVREHGLVSKEEFDDYTKALFSAIPVPDPTVKMDRIVLEGSIPSPANPPAGCKFHTRCANCMEKCKTEVPQQREIEPGHYVVCHLYDEA